MDLGTLAYGSVVGACAATALVFLIVGGRRGTAGFLALPVAFLAAAGGLIAATSVWLHTRDTVADYEAVLRVPFAIANLIGVVALVTLVVAWTKFAPRWVLAGIAAGTLLVGVLVLALPHSLLSGEVTSLRDVNFLGQQFVVHEAEGSPWRPVLDAYLVLTFGYMVVALVREFRHGRRSDAGVLTAGLGVLIGLSAYDSLVDLGRVSTPYLAPFGFMFIVAGAAVHASSRIDAMQRELQDHAVRLEDLVVTRTAALIDANDRLEQQLERQRLSARCLAQLSDQFERLNAVASIDLVANETEISLTDVLGCLGELVGADAIMLALAGAPPGGVAAVSVTWTRPDAAPGESERVTPYVLRYPVQLGKEAVGEIVLQRGNGREFSAESLRYVSLTSEHLAGFYHRLRLIGQIADTATGSERHRIARELHDSVTQRLYSGTFLAEALPRLVTEDLDAATQTAHRICDLLHSSLAELRSLLFELQPLAIDSGSLGSMLDSLGESVASEVDVEVEVTIEVNRSLPADVKLGLYRIAQESLTNAWRHGEADLVHISLTSNGEDALVLSIGDDGVGFDVDLTEPGHGLANLRERARLIGAELEVSSWPDSGVRVVASWPLPPETGGSESDAKEPSRVELLER